MPCFLSFLDIVLSGSTLSGGGLVCFGHVFPRLRFEYISFDMCYRAAELTECAAYFWVSNHESSVISDTCIRFMDEPLLSGPSSAGPSTRDALGMTTPADVLGSK